MALLSPAAGNISDERGLAVVKVESGQLPSDLSWLPMAVATCPVDVPVDQLARRRA